MNKKGFTLVEILAVIVILSLIITITATKGFGAFDNTKNKITEQNKKAIEEAAKVFLTDVDNCDDDLEEYKEFGDTYTSCDEVKQKYCCGNIPFNFLKEKNYIEGNDLNDDTVYNEDNIEIKGYIDNHKIIVSVDIKSKNKQQSDEKDSTLVNYLKNNDNIKINSGSPNFSTIEKEEKGMYLTIDNDGFTYYFRGKQSYNYVSFAGQIWRIVRINGDGSIRMILSGNIGQTAYNTFENVLASVSYVFGDKTSSDASIALTKDNPSNIKQTIDNWYNNKIKSKYDEYIQETTFCNDINYINDKSNVTVSYDSLEFYYSFGAEQRLAKNSPTPSLKCNENAALTLKIGLINADEVAFAGGSTKNNNTSYYLYSSNDFWTMSPQAFGKGTIYGVIDFTTYVYRVTSGKMWNTYSVANSFIRPVINLKKDVLVSEGDGSSSNPYIVKIN